MPTLRNSLIVLYKDIADNVKTNVETLKRQRINDTFVFMELEKSCKLIAFFEAVMALLQIIFIFRKGHYAPNSPYFLWVPGEREQIDLDVLNKRTRMRTNFHFTIGLNLITILNSLLLYIGTIKKYFVCLYLWIYISLFTLAMCTLNNTILNFKTEQIYLGAISLLFECYCIFIVICLILSYRDQLEDSKTEKPEMESESDSDFAE
ncbi:uncharacterized protein Dana_GF26718 [Drosophila ananassae]|uniref:Uncharacterized protein n=1 Tax=Drosophila ananassae TaxID=7217 RepID=A0A0P8ZNT3_DROAN|nr:uncharacterized protein LOC26514127 [Drosophila ananassae]KPU76314.1 uncharacterized protein Dana_GF26718 [Drosophila ananassae]